MRHRQSSRAALLVMALLVLGMLGRAPALAGRTSVVPKARTAPGQYIVTFRDGVATQGKAEQLSQRAGVGLRHVYGAALHGVAVSLSDRALSQLRADPDVAAVTEDYVVQA